MNTGFKCAALEYDDWFVRNEPIYRSELAAVKAFMPKEGRGLEIGVGTGRFAEPLGVKEGIEPSKTMGRNCQETGNKCLGGLCGSTSF